MEQGCPKRDKLRRSVAVSGSGDDKDDEAVFEQLSLPIASQLELCTGLSWRQTGRTWSNWATLLTVTAQPSLLPRRPMRSATSMAVPVTDACSTSSVRPSSGRGEYASAPFIGQKEAVLPEIRGRRWPSEGRG